MSERKFNISINKFIIDKPAQYVGINPATNWIPLELTQQQIIEEIKKGYAYTALFKDNYRKSENFISADFIAVDIDGGFKIEEILDDNYVKTNCSFVYTTPSHTEMSHRFRIVFLFDTPITNKNDWKSALRGIGHKLNGDPSIKDAARMFYGSSKGVFYNFNNVLSQNELNQIIDIGKQIKQKLFNENITQQIRLDTKSLMVKFDEIMLKDGTLRNIKNIPPSTAVFCPIHIDKKPSAFTVKSRNDAIGIHCSSCSLTYWYDDPEDYVLDEFDQLIQKLKETDFSTQKLPNRQNIKITTSKYLNHIEYRAGVHCIKSPKGSGKTEILKSIVSSIQRQEFSKSVPRKNRSKTVLLIGHRQTLLREAAHKLNLDCYLDQKSTTNFYAVCLDSLFSKLKRNDVKYDFVILDECEQVLQHILSKTLEDRIGIENSWNALNYVLKRAKSIIALDADLGFLSINTLKNIRTKDWEKDFYITYNNHIIDDQNSKNIELYSSEKHLISDLIQSINEIKKCFVVSNSKKFIQDLEQTLKQKCSLRHKLISITSDNSADEYMIDFVKNIKTRILDFQVLLASPSLGTGVDITFPNNEEKIDCVYGFFKSGINTHFDIDQQLSRVRHPKNIKIWLSNETLNYETNFDIIMKNLAEAGAIPSSNRGYDDDFKPDYDMNHPLLQIYTHVICAQRSSKKNLYRNFLSLKKKQGSNIIIVDRDLSKSKDGSSAIKEGAIKREQNRVANILAAPKIDDATFLEFLVELDEKKKLSKNDQYVFERAKIERSFKREINQKLIEMNIGDKLFDKVFLLKEIIDQLKSKYSDIIFDRLNDVYFENDQNHNWYVRGKSNTILLLMFKSIGIIKNNEFVSDVMLTIDDMSNLSEFWVRNKTVIEYQFNILMRSDVKSNPIKQLNYFLEMIGLKLVQSKKKMIKGVSRYYYTLDTKSYKFMMDLVSDFEPQNIGYFAKKDGFIFNNGTPNIKSYIDFIKKI